MRFAKSRFSRLLSIAACALCCGTVHAQTLDVAEVQPPGYPTIKGLEYMTEQVKKESGGRLVMRIFPQGKLGGETESIAKAKSGEIAFARVNLAQFNNSIPETGVFPVPFMFRNVIHMRKVVDGPIGEELLKLFDKQDLVGLAFYDSGSRSFYTVAKPIRSMEDLAGMRIRVQNSVLFNELVQAFGATPKNVPYGEVYNGLKNGDIDGAENNWPSYVSSKHFEVAKYYTLTEHTISPEVLVMSKKIYDKLSPADRALIRAAASDSVPVMRDSWDKYEEESIKAAKAAGVTVTILSLPEDRLRFRAAVKPLRQKLLRDESLQKLAERIQATK